MNAPQPEASPTPEKSRRMVWVVVLLAVASPFLLMALFVDDWSRDLTTNTANTAPDSASPPWTHEASLDAVADAVAGVASQNDHWRLADERPLPDDSPLPAMLVGDSQATHHLVRTTGLMGYQDDVWLVVEKAGDGVVRLHAESRSRVGKGDLGQNPRNLRELRSRLAAALGD